MDKVLAVIVSYNPDIEILRQCVCSVVDQVAELLVIDNHSDNLSDIAALLEEIDRGNIELKKFPINKGIAAAYNYGFQTAKSMGMEAVLTLDQDTFCPENLLTSLCRCMENESAGIVCPNVIDRNTPGECNHHEGVEDVAWCINSGALIRVRGWAEIGGYDEYLFVDLVDYDFCKRISDKGYKIIKVGTAVISHTLGEKKIYRVFGNKLVIYNHSASRKYYQSRNRFYLDRKYYGRITWNSIMRMVILLVKVWIGENDKRKKTAAIFRGARDGYRLGKRR
jgi:rhamnosyltransferase